MASIPARSERRICICRLTRADLPLRYARTRRAISIASLRARREFEEAHVFGTVRFVLDIWERYFGYTIPWHFARDYRQLEIVILPALHNAYAGYGFMEIGSHPQADGAPVPYALNFDVMAHELGHLIIYSTIGVPSPLAQRGGYYGFQKSRRPTPRP